LLQRVLTSSILVYFALIHLEEFASPAASLPQLIAALAGILFLLGLWTPLAGITIAFVEFWLYLASSGLAIIALVLAGMGATVAMIGPGIWSIDARLYGRKHLDDPRH
jgi:putative oxidoreductase